MGGGDFEAASLTVRIVCNKTATKYSVANSGSGHSRTHASSGMWALLESAISTAPMRSNRSVRGGPKSMLLQQRSFSDRPLSSTQDLHALIRSA